MTAKPDFSNQLCHICKVNPATTEHDWEFDEDYDHNIDRDYPYEDDPQVRKVYFPGPCKACEEIREKRRLERAERIRIKKIPEIITRYGAGSIYKDASLKDFPAAVLGDADLSSGFYIHGDNGAGKTHLAVALLREDLVANKRADSEMIKASKLFTRIRATYNGIGEETEQGIIEEYANTANLYLDDIGAEKATDWVIEILFRIIDERSENGRRTIFTSNFSLDELSERLGGRIADRIAGMCEIIHLPGDSRRLKK